MLLGMKLIAQGESFSSLPLKSTPIYTRTTYYHNLKVVSSLHKCGKLWNFHPGFILMDWIAALRTKKWRGFEHAKFGLSLKNHSIDKVM